MNGKMKNMLQHKSWRLGMIMMLALLLLFAAGCGQAKENNEAASNSQNEQSENEQANEQNEQDESESGTNGQGNQATGDGKTGAGDTQGQHDDTANAELGEPSDDSLPVVTIEMASGEVIKLELYPDQAPNTVHNFISLVADGFYDGLIFHRIIPNFVIQGGDPDGTGMGGPGYSIKGEFAGNGFKQNNLEHTKGVLSMARSQHPDSAGSQFFIMTGDSPHLDGSYAAFGKVFSGLDVVDEIVQLPRDAGDRPQEPPVMKKVTVDTKGIDYPEPEKIQS
ncbi:peptidylprolyl isomerase [Marinicrinis sediminis]|uniref:Peptidyl-prolyl cis-trans isomerase n=1 Tax=Marinicrinis sediminis TaxID=1652465 RepID=A0ABW5RCG9_9BACL